MATRVDVSRAEGGRVDVRRGSDGERLPWLEAVEDEDEVPGPGAAKLIGSILVGVVAIGAIVGGSFWLGRGDERQAGGQPEMILAEPGPYKVKPDEPGGMAVEGRGDTAFATSEGADPQAKIDMGAMPEAPVTAPPAPVRVAEPAAAGAQTAEAQPPRQGAEAAGTAAVPAPAAGGTSVQLGAFSSNASAEAAWKALAERFAALAPLGHSVQGATVNGRSVFRLRASVPDRAAARELCGRLEVAGESCVIL